jgi:hypothetical protein
VLIATGKNVRYAAMTATATQGSSSRARRLPSARSRESERSARRRCREGSPAATRSSGRARRPAGSRSRHRAQSRRAPPCP